MADPVRNCWFLTGPTASGKTSVGLELAERLGAEIVSLDSMAVYRGMDVGTAKPNVDQRQRTEHHLIDVVDPTDDYSLSQYVAAAHQKVEEIRARGRVPLFVGGTPLYLKALLCGIFEGPPADWDFRRQVEEELKSVGKEALHQRLWQVDPLSAARLHTHDVRRIIRALEVYKITGRPISHLQTQFEARNEPASCRVIALAWARSELHHRINNRVCAMFAGGLVEETRELLSRYGALGRTAAQAVGYRETIEHLRGERGRSATVELVATRTRRFVRRQETWFRSLPCCRRIEPAGHRCAGETADAILAANDHPPERAGIRLPLPAESGA